MNLPLILLLQLICGGSLFAGTFIDNVKFRNLIIIATAAIGVIGNYIILMIYFPPATAAGIYIPFAAAGGAITFSGYAAMHLSRVLARTKRRKWYVVFPLFLITDSLLLLILAILFAGLSRWS